MLNSKTAQLKRLVFSSLHLSKKHASELIIFGFHVSKNKIYEGLLGNLNLTSMFAHAT